MASASGLDEVLRASPGKTNFMRLTRLLICGGTIVLRELFDSIIAPKDLAKKLNDNYTILERTRRSRVLFEAERNTLFPPSGTLVESKSFDITLLFKLLRKICSLTAPATGWDNLPDTTDTSLEACLIRIKHYRNTIYAHVNEKMELSDDDFKDLWDKIKDALITIVTELTGSSRSVTDCEKAINDYRTAPLTDDDERNVEELKRWYLEDMKLKEMMSAGFKAMQKRMEGFEALLKRCYERETVEGDESSESQILELKIIHGEPIYDRQSTFQAHLASVTSRKQVDEVLNMLKEDNKAVKRTKTIQAFRVLAKDNNSCIQGSDDGDGEPEAGVMLLRLLEMTNVKNVVVVVTTNLHGEVLSGDGRLKHVVKSALTLLKSNGLVRSLTAVEEEELSKNLEEVSKLMKQNALRYVATIPEFQLRQINIIDGEIVCYRNCKFQSHLAVIVSQDQVEQVLTELKKKDPVAKATHNGWAYRIFDADKNTYIEHCEDDGDTSGARVLHLLKRTDVMDVMIVVTCWYETTADDLGPVRFKYIQKSVLDLLQSCGLPETTTKNVEEHSEKVKHTPYEQVEEERATQANNSLGDVVLQYLVEFFTAGSGRAGIYFFVNRYRDDPEWFINSMPRNVVLPTGVYLKSIVKG